MRLTALLSAACLCLLPACATVDMTEIAGQRASAKAPSKNVVQSATEKLLALLADKGLNPKTSEARMQSAANVLLRGLEEAPGANTPSYLQSVASADQLTADISIIQGQVEQTTKAAEVFLAMTDRRSLRVELMSLERALVKSRQAEAVFARAEKRLRTDVDLDGYIRSVDALRDVTNAFGSSVRDFSSLPDEATS